MKKIFYLSTCNTCIKILDQLKCATDLQKQDIKKEAITTEQLEKLKNITGSYFSLFSKRAIKFREISKSGIELKESDYRKLILQDYTFLKRPVIVVNDQVFIGNSKKEVEAAKAALCNHE